MIQRREHAGFTLESRHTLAIMAERFREKLDCDVPAELRIGGLVDVTHAACPQVAGDFVVCESASDHGLTNLGRHSIKHPASSKSLIHREFRRSKPSEKSQWASNRVS